MESVRRAVPGLDEWLESRACRPDVIERQEMDQRMRRDAGRWLGIIAVGIVMGLALSRLLWPAKGWAETVGDTVAIVLWLFVLLA